MVREEWAVQLAHLVLAPSTEFVGIPLEVAGISGICTPYDVRY